MSKARIRLLGEYTVLLDGREIPFPYAKLRALLAFLVMEGRTPIPRDRLAGLLWPD